MLTFHLKKEWFEKIKSGKKKHEYREVKPYWNKRLLSVAQPFDFYTPFAKSYNFWFWEKNKNIIEFVNGYAHKDDKAKKLKAKIKNISIINGKNTDLKIDKPVYDIEFELITK